MWGISWLSEDLSASQETLLHEVSYLGTGNYNYLRLFGELTF